MDADGVVVVGASHVIWPRNLSVNAGRPTLMTANRFLSSRRAGRCPVTLYAVSNSKAQQSQPTAPSAPPFALSRHAGNATMESDKISHP